MGGKPSKEKVDDDEEDDTFGTGIQGESYDKRTGSNAVILDMDESDRQSSAYSASGTSAELESGTNLFADDHGFDDEEDDDDAFLYAEGLYNDLEEDGTADVYTGADGAIYVDDLDQDYELYLQTHAFEFKQIEEDLFLMRRYGTRHCVILARETDPLVRFCLRLGRLEHENTRSLLNVEPVQYEEYEKDGIPGVLATFINKVLFEDPVFAFENSSGQIKEVGEERRIEEGDTEQRPEGVSLPADVVPIMTLDPSDRDYEERVQVAQRLMVDSGDAREWRNIDNRLHQDHMRPFTQRGNMAPHDADFEEGFSGQSPVSSDGERWFTINFLYFVLFRSFEQMCAANGNLLFEVQQRLARTGPENYVLGAPGSHSVAASSKDSYVQYSAEQERAVLTELMSRDTRNARLENEVFQEYARMRQFSEQIGGIISSIDLEQLRKLDKEATENSNSMLPMRNSRYADTIEKLQELAELCPALDSAMDKLAALRTMRSSETIQN